jgi:lipoprotein NlpD
MRPALGLCALALVAACTTTNKAPVTDRDAVRPPPTRAAAPAARTEPRPETYTVKRGDTLYSIALDNGLDYRELAEWNSISDPAVIQAGQELRLRAPETVVQVQPAAGGGTLESRPLGAEATASAAASAPAPAARPAESAAAPAAAPRTGADTTQRGVASRIVTGPKAQKLPYSEENLALLLRNDQKPAAFAPQPEAKSAEPQAAAPLAPAPGEDGDKLDWAWPAAGKVLAGFSEASNKGLDIAGKVGDPVYASAAGRVVYSGQGLRGYGKMIIIKHNPTYLSAYAHNSNLLVKEGQSVAKGQKIAEIGATDASQAKLHFEIRRQGKPIDPAKLLPDRAL